MADPANQIFLPWVQPGSATTIPDPATERLATDQPAAVSLKVTLTVNGEPLEKGARFYGPGDVTGIDPQQIVRLDTDLIRHRAPPHQPVTSSSLILGPTQRPHATTPRPRDYLANGVSGGFHQ